ncbi:MAG: hypothetical protein K6U08_08160 [Firmicutes bacterium]|nr:hypothetical protein [Bacillota bacterium]
MDEETIRTLFSQTKEGAAAVNHDLCQRPAVRLFNYRLTETPNGGLAIVADVEVLDEEVFSRMGGVSVSFTRTTVRAGAAEEPAVRVLVNPTLFSFNEFCNIANEIELKGYTIDVTELVQKAGLLEVAVIAVVISLASEVGKGFLSELGADLYRALKSKRRTDDPSGPTKVQLHVKEPIRLVLDVDSRVTPEEFAKLAEIRPMKFLPPNLPIERIDRVIGRVHAGLTISLSCIVLDDGTCIDLESSPRSLTQS